MRCTKTHLAAYLPHPITMWSCQHVVHLPVCFSPTTNTLTRCISRAAPKAWSWDLHTRYRIRQIITKWEYFISNPEKTPSKPRIPECFDITLHSTDMCANINAVRIRIKWARYHQIVKWYHYNAPFFVASKSTFSYSYGSQTIKGPQWMKFQATSGRWMTP